MEIADGTDKLLPPPTESKNFPKYSIVCRNGVGKSGRPIKLLANHFTVSFDVTDIVFYQYTVKVFSEDNTAIENKGIGRKLVDKLFQTYSSELAGKRYAYDGEKILYTLGPLPQKNFEFTIVLENLFTKCGSPVENPVKRIRRPIQSKTYKIELSYSTRVDLKSIYNALEGLVSDTQDMLRVLDIILRQQAANRGCLLVRQSFFHADSRNYVDVGGGALGLQGFHSGFCLTQGGLSLNMDVSTTMVLKPGPVIDFLKLNQNVTDVHNIKWPMARRMLKNMRIKTTHTNMEFKISGLSEMPCAELFFPMKQISDSGEVQTVNISVYDYFTKHYGIRLEYSASLPCIDVGKPKRPNYLPLELCSLVSLQQYKKALTLNQRAALVENSRQKPPEKMRILTNAVSSSHYDEDPVLSACGISLRKQLTELDGRILETPRLKLGNNEACIPRNGRWNFNNKKLLEPKNIERWIIVNFSAHCDISRISRDLISCASNKGIQMERPYTLIEEERLPLGANRPSPVARVEAMFEKITSKLPAAPELILCVLPTRKNSDIYGPWKKKCLSDIGVVTQCISPVKINDQYLTNVLLKINSKLGGINSLLEIERPSKLAMIQDIPTFILGMDVCHGPPGQSYIPSVAAVVGSRCWPLISRYRASVRTQLPKVEMIDALYKPLANGNDDGIIRELLVDFYRTSNGCKPKQIIVFRDGVSESQFNQVLNIELEQIIKAYQHLGEVDVPKFTVIVAQKNHHTKLFQADAPDNVPPGTVVDTKIVHPRNYDFYMCSHAGMIGTSRPAHYHVLVDEIGFSPDGLQNLVYSLSYVNQRSTSATSIVAPIFYAHLAARQMSQFLTFEDSSEASSEPQTRAGSIDAVQALPRLDHNVAGSMFFC